MINSVVVFIYKSLDVFNAPEHIPHKSGPDQPRPLPQVPQENPQGVGTHQDLCFCTPRAINCFAVLH